jgi:hypothetical protein
MRANRRIGFCFVLAFLSSILNAVPAAARDLKGDNGVTDSAIRKALLAAICEGGVAKSTCRKCPSFSGERSEILPIAVGPFHVGSFVTPGVSEAYVALTGCDVRPAGYTGGVLLRRARGAKSQWRVIRYDSGVDLRSCLRFKYKTGTTLLTCLISGDGAGGVFGQGISVNYTGPTESNSDTLIVVQDTSGACFANKDVVSLIGWKQRDVNGDKRDDLVLTVTESHAKAKSDDLCLSEKPPKVVTHTIPFLFDGTKFAPSIRAAATVKCLDNDEIGGEVNSSYCPSVR